MTLEDGEAVPSNHVDLICSHRLDLDCEGCRLRLLCLPAGLDARELEALQTIIDQGIPLARNAHLFRAQEAFTCLYAVLSGAVKTFILRPDGSCHVTGCHLPGDIFGYSGIDRAHYMDSAVALVDSVVCHLPFGELESMCRKLPALQSRILQLMSRRIVEHQILIGEYLDRTPAHKRLAAFLLGLSSRAGRRGDCAYRFDLPMTNIDIGSHLGISSETVSRELSRLVRDGVIRRDRRRVRILDLEALRGPLCVSARSATA